MRSDSRKNGNPRTWIGALGLGVVFAASSLGPLRAAGDDPPQTVLFRESFDDDALPARGWYDGGRFTINDDRALAGGCLEYHWKPGTTNPDGSSGVRRLFEPSDTLYVSFHLRLSPGWGWTGRPYHPHLVYAMTTENGRYHGPAASRLTVYVEANEGKLRLAAQDIQNRDAPRGLTQGPLRGGYNGTFFDSDEVVFEDDTWHRVEALFRLNSIDPESGEARADGVVRGWIDGRLVVDRSDVVLRSADYPEMKFNQLLIGPYFGEGLLPHEQTLWIDEMIVGTDRVETVDAADAERTRKLTRVGAAQPRNRTIDFRLSPGEVLERVDQSLKELEEIARKAGDAGCDVLAFPEDTLGLLNWEAAHGDELDAVLPEAVRRMLDRFRRVAASHDMSIVVCNDAFGDDGRVYNTAFLIGRDGREIGRYRKVNLPMTEQARARGGEFPVFPTEDLGTVGMLICYDMVFPESVRCLALAGADIVFHPTLGGAAFGDDDISLAAFRTRAADNFVYLVVAQRGRGSMIVSPKGRILATVEEEDGLAIADIDPHGGRQGGDAFNTQPDLRGRLFRERVPGAYGILTDPHPPVLDKVRSNMTSDEAIRVMATVLTTGAERFERAEELARQGETAAAIRLFEELCAECPTSWIDRAAKARLRTLRAVAGSGVSEGP